MLPEQAYELWARLRLEHEQKHSEEQRADDVCPWCRGEFPEPWDFVEQFQSWPCR